MLWAAAVTSELKTYHKCQERCQFTMIKSLQKPSKIYDCWASRTFSDIYSCHALSIKPLIPPVTIIAGLIISFPCQTQLTLFKFITLAPSIVPASQQILNVLYSLYFFETERINGQCVCGTACSHLLVYSSWTCNSHIWVRLKAGLCESMSIACVAGTTGVII